MDGIFPGLSPAFCVRWLRWCWRLSWSWFVSGGYCCCCFCSCLGALCCLAWPCLALFRLALPCLALPCLALPCLALFAWTWQFPWVHVVVAVVVVAAVTPPAKRAPLDLQILKAKKKRSNKQLHIRQYCTSNCNAPLVFIAVVASAAPCNCAPGDTQNCPGKKTVKKIEKFPAFTFVRIYVRCLHLCFFSAPRTP